MIGVVFFIGLVLVLVIGIEALRWTCRGEARRLRVIKKIGKGRLIIGTSGSHDYLEDLMGERRLWIVEAAELKGMGKGDVAALKACLSRQRDTSETKNGG